MAQRSGAADAEPELRAWLLADAVEFRRSMVAILLDPDHDWAEDAWAELSKPVDQLANGRPYRFHGWELPDEHPMARAYVKVDLVLDEHDVLRIVS